MRYIAPRRGVPWARIPADVQRVLIIRYGVIVTRTGRISKYGNPIWVCSGGRAYGYGGQIHVKPVYRYNQVFGARSS